MNLIIDGIVILIIVIVVVGVWLLNLLPDSFVNAMFGVALYFVLRETVKACIRDYKKHMSASNAPCDHLVDPNDED
ncbi:MAG: hypothetical protein QM500_18205 [Methylococcales bacterium]